MPSKARGLCLVFAFALAVPSPPVLAQDGVPFELPSGCSLPFADIASDHPIDDACGIEGKTTDAKNALQNRAKNNFCASGAPARLTRYSFTRLQRAVDDAGISYGSSSRLPSDRSPLQGIWTTSDGNAVGEGSLVQFVGFILDAHHSNVKKGETVNCKRSGRESNDIHIVLDELRSADPCHTVTAEMSPHFRPEDWDTGVLESLDRPVRLVGYLFFDRSHGPCTEDHRASPARASVWEIHPVYRVDVCVNTSRSACPYGDESKWVPLPEWIASEEGAEEEDGE